MHDNTRHTNDSTTDYSRRRFITSALAGAGVLAAGPARWSTTQAGAASRKGLATDIVTLGRTGIKCSRLAHGTGWNGGGRSSAHTRLGEETFAKLLRHSIDQGVAFVDAADLYGSHRYIRKALDGVPRDKYILGTKIWPRKEFWNSPSGGAKEEVNRFCKELDTDVLDICLIHCMTNTQWPNEYERIRDELDEMKTQGKVRAVGVSCHDLGALKTASAHPWVDVIWARVNNVGKSAAMDASVEEVSPILKQARANGKVVVGMKIFGAGELVKPEQKDASLKYVWQNELVDAITVGMMKPREVDDTIKRMNRVLKA